MIQPQELRIGNLTNEGMVVQIEKDCFYVDNPKYGWLKNTTNEINPIELTEEWLVKLGFEKTGRNEYNNDVITYNLAYGAFIVVPVGIENGEFCMEHIKYVHHLQNLYFALTGQELTIKE